MAAPRAQPLERLGDAAGGGDMVVLDQHRVIKPEAMIDPAAGPAPRISRRRAGPGVVLRVQAMRALVPSTAATIGRGQRGDAAQAAEKIERGPLAGEQRARLAGDLGDHAAGSDLAAVIDDAREA